MTYIVQNKKNILKLNKLIHLDTPYDKEGDGRPVNYIKIAGIEEIKRGSDCEDQKVLNLIR
jgi:hypothetical protein